MDMAQEAEAFAPEITEELPLSSPTESVANETMSSAGIPPEWQIPLTVFIALLGFLGVMALSALSARQAGGATQPVSGDSDDDDDDDYDADVSPSTPSKSSPRKGKKATPTGLVNTPKGRRSARIMKDVKTRKED